MKRGRADSTPAIARRRFLASALALSVTWTGRAAAEDPIKLIAPDAPPHSFMEDGVVKGMLVEVLREAFRRAGRPLEIRLEPWARCMEEVRWGRSDGFYVVYRTPEREKLYDFTGEPLEILQETFYVPANQDFDVEHDFPVLRRKRLGILEYTNHGQRMTRAIQNGQIGTVISVDSYGNLAKMLATGRVDMVLAVRRDMNLAIAQLGLQDRVKPIEPAVDLIPAFLVFTKARDMSEVRDAFDHALRTMKADGTYGRIIAKYGPEPPDEQ